MGAYCFGAYLVTDHELIRTPLWNAIHLFDAYQYGVLNTLGSIAVTVILLFLIGCGFEFIRSFIMGKMGTLKWAVSVDAFLNARLKGTNSDKDLSGGGQTPFTAI